MGTLKIVMVAASPEILGGQFVQAANLASALRGDGVDVSFLPIDPPFPRGLAWVRRWPYARTILNEALYLPSLAGLKRADVVHIFSAAYWSFLLGPAAAIDMARV